MSKILDAFRKAKAILSGIKFSKAGLVDGSIIQFDTDEIEKGTNVFMVDGAGDFSLLPDGAYLTKTQVNFTITDGIVSEVKGIPQVQEQEGPQKQAQAKIDTTSGEDDNPGENDGKPTAVNKDSTKGKGSIDLDKDKKPYGDVPYADPKNGKYPIDTEEHIRAAWNYINKGNAEGDIPAIKAKIIAAWKKKIDPAGPPSAQKQSSDDMSTLVNPPGGGAPDSLVNPDTIAADSDYATCMSKLNELHAQHGHLQGAHDKLRSEHDAMNAKVNELVKKHNALANNYDDMAKALAKANDDKLLMAKQIAILSKQPAGQNAEEIKTNFKKEDPDITESKIFKVLTSNKH